MSEQWRNVG